MFKITEETKAAAIEAMREILGTVDIDTMSVEETDAVLGDMFDVAVDIVKKQFGM
jgi:hypothetical protein